MRSVVLRSLCYRPFIIHSLKMCSTAARSRRLDGKVAIVTASTDGIGLSIAKQLANDGAKVVVSSRKQDNVIKATNALQKEGFDVMGVMCHVGKHEHRQNLIKRLVVVGNMVEVTGNKKMQPLAARMMNFFKQTGPHLYEIRFLLAGFGIVYYGVYKIQKAGEKKAITDKPSH
ncbi:Dehydrogenase/reductase SDR family member 4 [Exaiptasia diaphana]|nr:Dehydrogenase/reductase SDR family member 4 [Exaiptasia diaphana]